jgi:hypothetical protein
MLDDLEYAEKVLEKHKSFYEDEAKIIKSTIRYIDLLDEFGDNIDEALEKFAALYNGRYGHEFDKEMEYKSSALALFFLYGILVGKQSENKV